MVKVNFASIKDGPSDGTHRFMITEGDIEQNKESAKHPGNDYWRLTLQVQDGPDEGETTKTNVMLPPYVPYDLKNILRATVGQHSWSEEDIKKGEFDVEMDDLVDNNLEFIATIAPQRNNKDFKNVGNYRPVPDDWDWEDYNEDTDSLLPE